MKTLKGITFIVSLFCVMVSCTEEKEIFLPRDISAEFPSDEQYGEQKSFLFIDAEDTHLSAEELDALIAKYPSEVVYLCADYEIEGKSAGEYLVENCSKWGHKGGFAVKSGAVTTAFDGIEFKQLDIFVSGETTEPFIQLTLGGYNFVCGKILSKNSIYKSGKTTLIESTVALDGDARWIVVSRAAWENSTPWDIYQYYWPLYGFSECVFARFGQDSFPQRKDFVMVSEGIMGRIPSLEMSPLRFTFNYED